MSNIYSYAAPQRLRGDNAQRREQAPASPESNATEHAAPRVHSLANLVDGSVGARTEVIQRRPVKGSDDKWSDHKYTDVALEKLETYGHFRITSNSKVVYYDADDGHYYELGGDNEPDYKRPYDLRALSSAVVEPETKYVGIGAKGKGVGRVSKATTLNTFGLISCVGWLLYNRTAAYLTHIVVLEPHNVLANGGIQEQVNALSALFEEKTGTKPTNVYIKVDKNQEAYKPGGVWQSAWMEELVPTSCTATWERGTAQIDHVVQPSSGSRIEWDGPEIQVFTGEEDESGDIWTKPNTVIPSGGIFELEL